MKNISKEHRNIVGGALSLTVSALVVKFLGLVYKIPLSYLLSDEGMGYFNSAYTIYTFFFIICTAGVPKAISIMVADAEGDGDRKRVYSIYKSAFYLFFSFGLIITLIFAFSASFLSDIISSAGSLNTMLAIAPSILFVCASGVIRGYLSGRMKFVPIAVCELISGVLRLLLGLAFALYAYRMNYDVTVISAFTIFGTTLGSLASFAYLIIVQKIDKKAFKSEQKNARFSFKIASGILKLAIPLTLTSAIGSIGGIIDLVIIMQNLEHIGYTELQSNILYGNYTTLAVPMLNLITTLVAPVSAVLLPIISKKNVKNDSLKLSHNISFATNILLTVAFPVSILFLVRPYEILSILFEDSSAILAAPTLAILAPGILIMCMLTVINTSLEGMEKTRIPLISLFVGSVFKVIITYILIRNTDLGILGAPIGTAASYLVSFVISFGYISIVKKVNLDTGKTAFNIFASSAIALVFSTVFKHFTGNGIIFYIADIMLFVAVYSLLMLFLNFRAVKDRFFK